MTLRVLRTFLANDSTFTRSRAISSGRWFGNIFGRSDEPPRQFAAGGFQLLDATEKLEEENWEWYSVDAYYPVQIGETFQSRYQVLGKLGYGAHSTAWLGRDLRAHRYVTLKVCERDSRPAKREVAAYKHLNSLRTRHQGSLLTRQLLDSFTITVPTGEHLCLVHEPLGMSVETFMYNLPAEHWREGVLKSVVKCLLLALDFLHGEGKMIHADLQASNIHFRVEGDDIFQKFEAFELKVPSRRKIDGNRTIYETRGLVLPSKTGPPTLCDFGEARFGKATYTDDIQPYVYRAPEVILDIPWSCAVDIWNVGVMMWDLLEDRHLFSARHPTTREQARKFHLAEMCAILGPPPLDYLQRSETSWEYFEKDGTWKQDLGAPIPDMSLEASEIRLSGDSKTLFLNFVRCMLQWKPEERYSAKQLLQDPWLNE